MQSGHQDLHSQTPRAYILANLPYWFAAGLLLGAMLYWGTAVGIKLLTGTVLFLAINRILGIQEAALAILVFYAVVQVVVWEIPLFNIYPLRIGLADIAVGIMLLLMIVQRTVKPQVLMQKDPFLIPILLVLAGSILSMFAAHDIGAALALLSLMVEGYVMYRFILSFTVRRADLYYQITLIMAALGLTMLLGYYAVYIKHAGQIGPGFLFERLNFVFSGPNGLGAILTFATPLCLIPILSRSLWQRLIGLFLIAGSVSLLLPTYSRNSYLCFLISVVVIGLLLFRRRRLAMIGAVAGTVVLLSLLIPNVVLRATSVGYFQYDMSALSRLILWRVAWTDFVKHPFTGVGLANFWYTALNVPLSGFCHNLYLSFFAETGLLGGIGVLSLFVVILRKSYRALKRSHEKADRYLGIALVGCWSAFSVHNLFDQVCFFVDRTHEMKFFWLILGMTAAFVSIKQSHEPASTA